jgi:hypothetical protein
MRRVSGVQGAVRSVVQWWWDHWQEFGRASRGVPCVDASGHEAEEWRGW